MLADESIRWLIEEAKTSSLAVGQTILLCFSHALKYFKNVSSKNPKKSNLNLQNRSLFAKWSVQFHRSDLCQTLNCVTRARASF